MEYLEMTLSICGAVAIIGGAGAVIWKVIRPAMQLVTRVSVLERKADNDYTLLQKLDASNRTQNLALLSMVNHMIDGNGVDKLRDTRDRLQRELMEQ